MTLLPAFLIFIFGVINHTGALKCYVCHETTSPHSCDEFEKSEPEALEKFVVECKEPYVGCLTQKQGDNTIRDCDVYAFNDCQSANGISYCYCSKDRCNGPDITRKMESTFIDLSNTDDEDYVDMSGNGNSDTVTQDDGFFILDPILVNTTTTVTAKTENITNKINEISTTVKEITSTTGFVRNTTMFSTIATTATTTTNNEKFRTNIKETYTPRGSFATNRLKDSFKLLTIIFVLKVLLIG